MEMYMLVFQKPEQPGYSEDIFTQSASRSHNLTMQGHTYAARSICVLLALHLTRITYQLLKLVYYDALTPP